MLDTTPTTDHRTLLRQAETYLTVTHDHAGRHDTVGMDLTCGGCQLRTRLTTALTARQVLGTTDQQPETTPVDTDLRNRIAEVLATADGIIWGPGRNSLHSGLIEDYHQRADAVLAVLPASVDRSAVLREAADDPDGLLAKVNEATSTLRRIRSTIRTLKDQGATGYAYYQAITDDLAGPRPDRDEADGLRRMADEAQQPEVVDPFSYEERERTGRNGGLDLPKTEAGADTLPAWLHQRFAVTGPTVWGNLDDDQRSYWEHQAKAVRRAVTRNGFKPAADRPDTETEAAK
ncbi:hypothetical protein ABT025_18695 [Streptomyces sp. NPDC002809]|uniref:hypothetical protein n=1 Tax=Streptomyces sp. NPDC002809 TaxID=3154433 RepID=UPI00332A5071